MIVIFATYKAPLSRGFLLGVKFTLRSSRIFSLNQEFRSRICFKSKTGLNTKAAGNSTGGFCVNASKYRLLHLHFILAHVHLCHLSVHVNAITVF
jgi:hypothetical protein